MTERKKYEDLDFTDDFMFCKILQNNEALCKELLELIIGKKIEVLRYPEKQKAIEITSDGKGIRLDIYVEDENNAVYDVEMQTTSSRNLPKRSRYYQGMIDLNLIERGAKYEELKKSYIIFICTFDYFGMGLHKYTFYPVCKENPEMILDDGTVRIFLCAGGGANDVSRDMKDFLDYLVDKRTRNEFTAELDHAVIDARKHEKWRDEFMTLLMRDQENQEIGKEIGQRDKLKELIKKKLAKGYSTSEIADMLEEEPELIEELIKEMQT
ncbi:MAG: Rpn family recombination-promoting nuclease/putative transposase [Hespellia sp.]|nr:Rpn family recombination-promoting nuclease/putative transposase [Hespellia sp.]